jgi:hypothetical protein
MKQMDVPEEMKVEYNLDDWQVPVSAKILQPVLFKDGDSYCCVLGPDPTEGILGCGPTPDLALQDWDVHVRELLDAGNAAGDVAEFIRVNLKSAT